MARGDVSKNSSTSGELSTPWFNQLSSLADEVRDEVRALLDSAMLF